VTENLLKDSFAVMSEQESRYSWLDHNHGASVKFVDADDSEYEVWASHCPHYTGCNKEPCAVEFLQLRDETNRKMLYMVPEECINCKVKCSRFMFLLRHASSAACFTRIFFCVPVNSY